MESRGFSKTEAVEVALQIFHWGMRAAMDQLRPSRPQPSDLPKIEGGGQAALFAEAQPAKPAKPRKEPAKGLHRIPPGFGLDEDMRKFALDRAFDGKAILAMWEKFFNHYAGNGATAVDWKAKWRTWVMKTIEFNTRDGRGPGGGPQNGNFL